jgi:MFS family permease
MSADVISPASSVPPPSRGALGAIFLVVVTDLLGFGLIIPLLPFYVLKFEAGPFAVGFLFAIFSICQFIAAPLLGSLSDRIGRRRVLIFSQIGSALGYVLLAWASAHEWHNLTLGLMTIYLSRIIDGLSGGNISAAQAYIADVTTPAQRARGMGLLGAAFGIGFAFGPALGGLLAWYVSPSAPAWAAAALAALAALLSYWRLVDVRPTASVETQAWLHPRQFIPILRDPVLLRINLLWFCAMGAFVMMDSFIAYFLADLFAWNEAHVGGYFFFVGMIILIVQGGLVHRLNVKLGEWRLCWIGLAGVTVGSLLTAMTSLSPLVTVLMLGAFVHAFGRSLFQPAISALVSRETHESIQGASLGLFQGAGTLARALWPLLAGLLYKFSVAAPWLAGAGVTLACAAAALLWQHQRRSTQEAP